MAFALVSGMGLAIDFLLFALLVHWGAQPGWANILSARVAVAFVFFASVQRIFAYDGGFLFGLFLAYLLYQIVAVIAASVAVGVLAARMSPLLAKLAVLPATFTANFAFMSLLTRGIRARIPAGHKEPFRDD